MDPSEIRKELETIAAKKAALLAEQARIEELEKAFALVADHLASKKNVAATADPGNNQVSAPFRKRVRIPAANEPVFQEFGGGKSKSSTIREVIEIYTSHYNVTDVYNDLVAKNVVGISKNDVSFALSRMCKAGKIFLVKQGAGKAPSVYSNSKPPPWVTFGNRNSPGVDQE
jgi:hypothetical protein